MKDTIVKTRRNREVPKVKSGNSVKVVTEEDIRRRAYEIYREKGGSSGNSKDDWFRAENELRGETR